MNVRPLRDRIIVQRIEEAEQRITASSSPTPLGKAAARQSHRGQAEEQDLPASALAGVSETSALGKRVANLTVADVGAMTLADFVAHAIEGGSSRRRKEIAEQAEAVWRRAQNVTSAYAPEPEEPDNK
jgi:hypothetical protein